ncbi:succinate dehydrogenase cytochrome b subunit [Verrucomicrobium sp. BvORR106]|uniref:succinate dehydrogenase cytochrome b subunit n=1 Tax=Verrucomicrobium sp. BvORR106 TaxID=1403819 RepID=UPI000571A819|nr:succinate dehydrogenase cytochrome b subunit [Verrucomicrobium sp. BvORR106]
MSTLTHAVALTVGSSIGKKALVAVTGAVLAGFVLGHMIGNLLIFAGPDAINEYGHLLQTMLHGMGVWVARIGLLACTVVHVVLTVQLTRENRAARPGRYGYDATIQATRSSRTMIFSGLTLLAFIVYHLMHFTLRVGNEYATYKTTLHGEQVHDVYRMVIDGFSWWPASVFYLIAMAMLCSHLSHGVSSMFQTLGLSTPRTMGTFRMVGRAYAALIFGGNAFIVLAVWFKWVH